MGLPPITLAGTGPDGVKRYKIDESGSIVFITAKPNRATFLLKNWIRGLEPDNLKKLRSNDPFEMKAVFDAIQNSYVSQDLGDEGVDLPNYSQVTGISLDLSCGSAPPNPSLIQPNYTGAYLPLTFAPPVTARVCTEVRKTDLARRVSKIEITLPGAVKRRSGELTTLKPETVQSFAADLSKCIPLALRDQLEWLDKNPIDTAQRTTAGETIANLVEAHLDRLQCWGVDDRRVDLALKGSLYRHASRPITIQLREGMPDTQLIIVAEHDGTKRSEETATAGGVSV